MVGVILRSKYAGIFLNQILEYQGKNRYEPISIYWDNPTIIEPTKAWGYVPGNQISSNCISIETI